MRTVGARYLGDAKCEFTVWAPFLERLVLSIPGEPGREVPLQRDEEGYFQAVADDVPPGTKYHFSPQGRLCPDPASYSQPEDVFGPSCVVDHSAFGWRDSRWKSISLKDMVIYELHIGTFTPEGTFEAAAKRLGEVADLGITAVDIMPVAQFPGTRNWGYDGVFPFAVQHSYGGPDGLKGFVDACHRHNLAVVLDVVYNHLGPEGNVLEQYMPVFTDKYRTSWGRAINFDDAYSDGVRNFFIQNALFWFRHYHVDALRLDAIHGIFDMSAKHFLRQLAETVGDFSLQNGRTFILVAESDLNERRIVLETSTEGYGIDSQWSDDFHHAIHAVLTGEAGGYYRDFGSVGQIVDAMATGFVYAGGYSPYRKRRHGSPSGDIPPEKFVVFIQNHDQIGNRLKGERLTSQVGFEALKLAAGALVFSPYVPLVFMGEEYGETAPFPYFMSFHDGNLVEAVRQGRLRDFASFGWQEQPPDPWLPETFMRAKLNWDQRHQGEHKVLLSFYKKLFEWRKAIPALGCAERESMEVGRQENVITVKRQGKGGSVYLLMNFSDRQARIDCDFTAGGKIMDSSEKPWSGPGSMLPQSVARGQTLTMSPYSLCLYQGL
jgi:maltooligosyltrehalose trehalohydrolase